MRMWPSRKPPPPPPPRRLPPFQACDAKLGAPAVLRQPHRARLSCPALDPRSIHGEGTCRAGSLTDLAVSVPSATLRCATAARAPHARWWEDGGERERCCVCGDGGAGGACSVLLLWLSGCGRSWWDPGKPDPGDKHRSRLESPRVVASAVGTCPVKGWKGCWVVV